MSITGWGWKYGAMVDFDSIRVIDDDSDDTIGSKRETFEVDYPDVDGTWSNSEAVAEKMPAGLGDGTAYDVVRGDAIQLGLDLR
jgi:hypothetical protein